MSQTNSLSPEMPNNNHIQQEQQELAPVLFQTIDNGNIYTVPEGYFEELPIKVLGRIEETTSTIPEGYFEELPLKILGKVQQGLESVPEDYFEELPLQILGRLSAGQKQEKIPNGYFDELPASLLQRIKSENAELSVREEIKQLSPVIAEIGNEHPFTVPANYFLTAQNEITQHINTARETPVVKMATFSRIVRYAVAAAVVGLLSLGIYNIVSKNEETINPVVMAQADKIIKTNSIDAAFEELTEADITDYMTNKGTNINAALVASHINDADLPAAEDYMFNEDALNEYLKEKNISN